MGKMKFLDAESDPSTPSHLHQSTNSDQVLREGAVGTEQFIDHMNSIVDILKRPIGSTVIFVAGTKKAHVRLQKNVFCSTVS